MSLTPKQEKFCQCIVSGMSGKDSYMAAYDCKSDNAAMVESTKLLKRDDVTQRLVELRRPIETLCATKAISEREKKRAVLWDIIENGDNNDKCRALDILNKMDAEYTNVNVNKTDSTVKLDNIDLNALRALSE